MTELLASLAEVRSRVKYQISLRNNAGRLDFGENYVQELEEKARKLPADIRWDFTGTLQSNKAKTLVSIPNLFGIQTLGSVKAASALNKALPLDRISPSRVLLQVNTSGEDSKSGLPPLTASMSDLENLELLILAQHILTQCPKLGLEGLMTIGALKLSLSTSETEKYRFRKAQRDRRTSSSQASKQHLRRGGGGGNHWGEEPSGRLLLSMGMSSDFEAALKSGSDIVRVSTGKGKESVVIVAIHTGVGIHR
ncbi:hypothetical protein BYT27DRAFT_6876169 [Phlegmacium glaucopus]|nr:hypothetical protein BYT27DRAFT_6876169 [Phlegmacium glaucopus]